MPVNQITGKYWISFTTMSENQFLLYAWSGVRKGDLQNFMTVMNPTSQS